WAHGHGRLSRVLSLVLFGDLVSVYLAYLNEVDPTPVAAIDELKRRLES
ncbi:MAG: SIS domain-containing protein, partial [Armatimonadota bacterium]|nr:SIS domain-containing protein [Armatimonadota bacterium]